MTSRSFIQRSLVALAAAALCVAGMRGQQAPVRDLAPMTPAPPVGTASLSGRVMTDESSPKPVRRASVRLAGSGDSGGDRSSDQAVITDEQGVFAFTSLPAGRYFVTASRPGFVTSAYGAKRPEGTGSAITLTNGQQMSDVALPLLRGAVIDGVVRDQHDAPIAGVMVSVLRYGFSQNGQRTLRQTGQARQTDDRGGYRVYGLAPGEYLVVATQGPAIRGNADVHQMTSADVQWATRMLQGGGRGSAAANAPPSPPNLVSVPIFYPGTPVQANAATIALRAGEERSGVDIPLQFAPAARLDGTIATADGSLPPNMTVNLLAHERLDAVPFSGFSASPSVRNGAFTFQGVTPGDYTVTVRVNQTPAPGGRGGPAPTPAMLTLYGLADVTMTGQDQTVAVTLQRGATVSGHVAFDGATPLPTDFSRVRIGLSPVVESTGVAIGVAAVNATAAGTFSIEGVAPGRYLVTTSSPAAGWQPRSATIDGRDAMDMSIEISGADVSALTVTYTDHPAGLSGTVQDASGRATPEYFVIVFPHDRTFWTPASRRIQSKRPAQDGRYAFVNLPPGDYLLAALTDVEQGQWYDPAFLAELSQAAIPVTIGDGEKKVQDVRVAR